MKRLVLLPTVAPMLAVASPAHAGSVTYTAQTNGTGTLGQTAFNNGVYGVFNALGDARFWRFIARQMRVVGECDVLRHGYDVCSVPSLAATHGTAKSLGVFGCRIDIYGSLTNESR